MFSVALVFFYLNVFALSAQPFLPSCRAMAITFFSAKKVIKKTLACAACYKGSAFIFSPLPQPPRAIKNLI
jgi:hypothetical protein